MHKVRSQIHALIFPAVHKEPWRQCLVNGTATHFYGNFVDGKAINRILSGRLVIAKTRMMMMLQ